MTKMMMKASTVQTRRMSRRDGLGTREQSRLIFIIEKRERERQTDREGDIEKEIQRERERVREKDRERDNTLYQ